MTKKDDITIYSWKEVAYKIDPQLSMPEREYVFDNGNRVFYKPRMNINVKFRNGNRKKS